MPFVFPAELAGQIADRWQGFSAAHHNEAGPPLPSPRFLQFVLETAFFASLVREEGRSLKFVLCCLPGDVPLRDVQGQPVPMLPIEPPRSLTVESIRALAPAVNPASAALLVRTPEDPSSAEGCFITGVLQIGGHVSRARSGRSFYDRSAPVSLTIDVREAGELHIYQGDIKVAALASGRLLDQVAFSALEFLPITEVLARGEQALRAGITPPTREPVRESSDFEWTALLGTLLSIVNGIKEHGHGGILLLVAPGSEATLPVQLKYDVGPEARMLGARFTRFLNARHALADERWRRRLDPQAPADDAWLAARQVAALSAEGELGDVADLVARLSNIDGALVITSDLRLIGFGAEIVADAAAPVAAFEATGHWGLSGPRVPVDPHGFGMRHRSALRCVSTAEHTAAFVVSQDGGVSFFWKLGTDVLLKRHINTANPAMLGGW